MLHGIILLYQSATEPWEQLLWEGKGCSDMLLTAPQHHLLSWICWNSRSGTTIRDVHLALQINSHTTSTHVYRAPQAPRGTGQPVPEEAGPASSSPQSLPWTASPTSSEQPDKDPLSTSQVSPLLWRSFPERSKRMSGTAQISTWIYKQQIKFSSYKTMF